MEINITIFIQALILLMLFTLLSHMLFYPLKRLANQRFHLLHSEKNKIDLLELNIGKQRYYLNKTLFVVKNKLNKRELYLNKNIDIQKKVHVKRAGFNNNEKYKHVQFKFINEILSTRDKINKNKEQITINLIEKLNSNQGVL